MEPKTNEEPFIDLTDYGQYQVRINVSSKERGLEVIKALAEKDREKEEAVADIIKMSDQLELECGLDGDKGTKQWMAFKGFRNTIRDKYLTPPTN